MVVKLWIPLRLQQLLEVCLQLLPRLQHFAAIARGLTGLTQSLFPLVLTAVKPLACSHGYGYAVPQKFP